MYIAFVRGLSDVGEDWGFGELGQGVVNHKVSGRKVQGRKVEGCSHSKKISTKST
jgi:hypothetical protein